MSAALTHERETSELQEFLPDPLILDDFSPDERLFSFDQWPPFPRPWQRPFASIAWIARLSFGLVSLVALLSILAAIPVLNLLVIGYLLEAQGRVARTGRLTYCVPLLPLAPRLGSIALGVSLWLVPIIFISDAAADAALIAPTSPVAFGWQVAKAAVSVGIGIHLVLALARGGTLGTFVRPIKNVRWLIGQLREGTYFQTADFAIRDFIAALRLRHHFWLGLRGYLGTFAWIAIPTALFVALRDVEKPGQVLVTLAGGALLIPTLAWVPWLQCRFAMEQRMSAFLQLRTIREEYRRCPFLFTLAVVILYAVTLPLFFFKVAVPPRDAVFLMTPVFLTLLYPAKIFIAWVYSRAIRREHRTWLIWRWTWRLVLLPLLAIYIFLLFLTPAISAYGRRVLFEHPALLLPAPF